MPKDKINESLNKTSEVLNKKSKKKLKNLEKYGMNEKIVFTRIYKNNEWNSEESSSGTGSTLKETEKIREKIPPLIESLKIERFLDAPCGDFNWMKFVNLPVKKYIGLEIVEEIAEKNKERYSNKQREFLNLNILKDILPESDIIMCRDCLVHFPFEEIFTTIKNFKKTGAKYLLTTTFPKLSHNLDLSKIGDWRALNLEIEPFNFPKPLTLILEELDIEDEVFKSKSLGLWKLDQLI